MEMIYFNRNHPITISREGYEQICRIVERARLCQACERGYSPDRPHVLENRCVECVLEGNPTYTFIGDISAFAPNSEGRESQVYGFLDQEGYVQYSEPDTAQSPRQSAYYTLKYYHFPLPDIWETNGVVERVEYHTWSIYGKPQRDQVVIVTNHDVSSKYRTLHLITSREGHYRVLDKRKKEVRTLLQQARKRTKARGEALDDFWVFEDAAAILNERYPNHLF